MRKADVYNFGILAGQLEELKPGKIYKFVYLINYSGPAVSLSMPLSKKEYTFENFPPFFEGLLPEGIQLEGLVRKAKVDKNDYMGQLLITGADLVGSVTVMEVE
jgi:serine/threonine-protein kinase HipA